MGVTSLVVEVANPARPDVTIRLKFMVDSGAVYSVVPAATLRKLGVKPLRREEFGLANGTRVRRRTSVAVFKYADRIGGAPVIFGEKGDSILLGALTLEGLGLMLDPLRRELRPLPMMLGVERSQAASFPAAEANCQAASFPAHPRSMPASPLR